MDSAIGKGLRQSPRLLATTTAVAVALVAATLILTAPSGQKFDQGRGLTWTLAMIGCLYLGFVAARVPGTAGSLGFRLAPRMTNLSMLLRVILLAPALLAASGCGAGAAREETKAKEEKAQELFKADLTRSDMLGWASLPTHEAKPGGGPAKQVKLARFKGSKATVVVSERWFGLEPPERRQMIQQVADSWAKARQQAGFTGDDMRAPVTLIASGGSTQGTWEPGSGPKAWGVQ